MNNEIESRILAFQLIVSENFHFLIEEHGFVECSLKKLNFEYSQDKMVELNFKGEFVCISIAWHLINADISVGIIELINNCIPDNISYYGGEGKARGISLVDFVEFTTHEKNLNPLPQATLNEKISGIKKKWLERDAAISYSMESIISTYASMLKKYGREIIRGELTIFPEIQKYSRIKIMGE